MKYVLFVCTQNAGRSQMGPYVPTVAEDWDVADPGGKSIEEVRAIRDDIAGRVDDLVLKRACADAVLSHSDDVPIRTHVLTLAQQRTSKCLRADACYELAVVG